MTGAIITELLIKFGPIAFDWLEELHGIWTKEMSADEVKAFVASKRKSYDDYISEERARRTVQP